MPRFSLQACRPQQEADRSSRGRWVLLGSALCLAGACGRFGFENLPEPGDLSGGLQDGGVYSNFDGLPDAGGGSTQDCGLGTLANCSACGDDCSAQSLPGVDELACVSAACIIASCAPDYGDCDSNGANGCETSLRTLEHCGGCNRPCAITGAQASCASGSCERVACAPSYGDCDADPDNGCERQLDSLTNCNGCDTPCSLPNGQTSCAGGACQLVGCANGFDDCDGNPDNGCETPLDTLSDCGGCGVPCGGPPGSSCAGGVCSVAACAAFFADCDGDGLSCETDLRTLSDCVSCGVGCGDQNGRLDHASASCASGACAVGGCDAGWDDCDASPSNGCETRVNTLTDCSACNVGCSRQNATASCAAGSCQTVSCEPGFDDCDGVDANGCEAQLGSNAHCAGCGDACGTNEACSGGTCAGQFVSFAPSNIDVGELDPAAAPALQLDCGTVTLDTTSLGGSGWCGGPAPQLVVQTQTGGPELLVVPLRSLVVAAGTTFRISGSRPVAFAVFGDVDVAGSIDVGANGPTGGAGNHWDCFSSLGTNGTGTSGGGGGGGGGGAFAASGGKGGNSGGGSGGIGGVARGNPVLSPLIPGCNGGWGGGCGASPGGGGGALQIAATGLVEVSGSLLSRGGNGVDGCGAKGGASGGGSGGAILVEADRVVISGGSLLANGGNGGSGAFGGAGGFGSSSGAGQDGTSHSNGGGGGGGSAGRIRIVGASACTLGGSSSPAASMSCP